MDLTLSVSRNTVAVRGIAWDPSSDGGRKTDQSPFADSPDRKCVVHLISRRLTARSGAAKVRVSQWAGRPEQATPPGARFVPASTATRFPARKSLQRERLTS